MTWLVDDTWIVVVGMLCAAACALPGCYLVLRQMSMMGDAISHAVLPGLAIAFMVSSSRSSLIMFVGAALVGVLTAVFTQWISSFGRVDRGASMGIVFTTLFALGLVLIVQAADHVDLDPGCVLYGAIETTPYDVALRIPVGADIIEIPRAAIVLAGMLAINLTMIVVFYKEFNLTAFDPALADTLGFSSAAMHYLLMILVALTTVAAFEVVGSILVIAMFIVPPATAFLLTRSMGALLTLSVLLGAASAFLGHLAALGVPRLFGQPSTNTSGMIAVTSGLLFVLAWLLGPEGGLLRRRRLKTVVLPGD